MALEPRASPGNAGLSPNSAFLLQPFVFFLLFPPRCFFPLLSKALCFFFPLFLLPFCQPSLSQLQEQAESSARIFVAPPGRLHWGVPGVPGHAEFRELQLS